MKQKNKTIKQKGRRTKRLKRTRHQQTKTKQDGKTTKQTRQGHIMETKKTKKLGNKQKQRSIGKRRNANGKRYAHNNGNRNGETTTNDD